jgi:hypothetical protein
VNVAVQVADSSGVRITCVCAPASDQPAKAYSPPPPGCGDDAESVRWKPTTPIRLTGVGWGSPSSRISSPGGSEVMVNSVVSGRIVTVRVDVNPLVSVAVRVIS